MFNKPGNTKGGSITVPLTSCWTGLDQSVLQIKTKIVSCHTADSKPVKQEVNSTVILPPLVFPEQTHLSLSHQTMRSRLLLQTLTNKVCNNIIAPKSFVIFSLPILSAAFQTNKLECSSLAILSTLKQCNTLAYWAHS